jgi:hypothetical protein
MVRNLTRDSQIEIKRPAPVVTGKILNRLEGQGKESHSPQKNSPGKKEC